jgi:hypothetical protein
VYGFSKSKPYIHSIPYCYLLEYCFVISHFTSKKTAAMMLFENKQNLNGASGLQIIGTAFLG